MHKAFGRTYWQSIHLLRSQFLVGIMISKLDMAIPVSTRDGFSSTTKLITTIQLHADEKNCSFPFWETVFYDLMTTDLTEE